MIYKAFGMIKSSQHYIIIMLHYEHPTESGCPYIKISDYFYLLFITTKNSPQMSYLSHSCPCNLLVYQLHHFLH